MLQKEFETHDLIVLTGGSGLFIDALCFGLDDIPTDETVKNKLQQELEDEGIEQLQLELKQLDPEYYNEVDIHNPRRVMRALEAIRITGMPYSQLRLNDKAPRDFKVHIFVIDHDRDNLYQRINKRVDLMINEGLVDEAKRVLPYRYLTTLNTVGYKELFEYFNGKTGLENAIENIKRNTRRYAKRQITWFKRYEGAHWIPFNDKAVMLKEIESIMESEITGNE